MLEGIGIWDLPEWTNPIEQSIGQRYRALPMSCEQMLQQNKRWSKHTLRAVYLGRF